MKYPYLISSDQHCHAWDAFSKVGPDGVNSRLRAILDELERSYEVLHHAGGDTAFLAGDLFHQKGEIKPSVFNPTQEAFERAHSHPGRVSSYAIPGNHDLESKESSKLGNAMQSLGSIAGFNVCVEPTVVGDVVVFPWYQNLADLRAQLTKYADPGRDAIIHAPINGVIIGIPDHGFNPDELAAFGYRRVFAGHYHDHKVYEGGKVVSVGATTHQTWSDPGTKAGFLLVYEDRVEHIPTAAPRFVDLTDEDAAELGGTGDLEDVIGGNYVRLKLTEVTEAEVKSWREDILAAGAAGVVILSTKKATTGRSGAASKAAISLEASVEHYVVNDLKPLLLEEVSKAAADVLAEARA